MPEEPAFGRVDRDAEAAELWREHYSRLTRAAPGLLASLLSRAEPQVARLSLVYAVLDGSHTVRVEHLRAALAVWDYCEQSTACIFGDAIGDPLADELLAMLRAAVAGLTRNEIRDRLGRNRPSEVIGRALGAGTPWPCALRAGSDGGASRRALARRDRQRVPAVSAADLDRIRRVIDIERARVVRLIAAVDRISATPPTTAPVPAPPVRLSGLLTRREAADALGVSLAGLDRMRRRGDLAVVRPGAGDGARVMVPVSEVRRIAASAQRARPPRDTRHRARVVLDGPAW
jgi:hypothetical protein